jgi:6-phosphogluconate dehydrogenase
MKLGYIGLGKMGLNMVERLLEKGHSIVAHDPNAEARERAALLGASPSASLRELVGQLVAPRTIWLMVPYQVIDTILEELTPLLEAGDTVIDGGNSPYQESMRRAQELEEKNLHFMDVGVSGGPAGARNGACLMVGGKRELFERHEDLLRDIAVENGYGYMGKSGAGHFVKMVHNGIEYGMMQAIAEGFAVMKQSEFGLDLQEVARVYNHQSVITSRLTGWLEEAFKQYGEDLADVSGSVAQSGEGVWTLEAAQKLGVPVKVIEDAVRFREQSQECPSYTGKIVSALRHQFGGHEVKSSEHN